jgi:peroxiredoxin Q/BCP
MNSLKIGDKAPEFLVKISEDKEYSLEGLKGKYVVLYFYPKDDTPGCTLEAMDFNELLQDFQALNSVVLGVSRDDLKSHNKFKDKYNLKFNLGSDLEGATCSKYAVWVEKSMFGKKYMGVNRATFLIDTQGKIAHIWPKVSVEGHAREVLDKVRSLASNK